MQYLLTEEEHKKLAAATPEAIRRRQIRFAKALGGFLHSVFSAFPTLEPNGLSPSQVASLEKSYMALVMHEDIRPIGERIAFDEELKKILYDAWDGLKENKTV